MPRTFKNENYSSRSDNGRRNDEREITDFFVSSATRRQTFRRAAKVRQRLRASGSQTNRLGAFFLPRASLASSVPSPLTVASAEITIQTMKNRERENYRVTSQAVNKLGAAAAAASAAMQFRTSTEYYALVTCEAQMGGEGSEKISFEGMGITDNICVNNLRKITW